MKCISVHTVRPVSESHILTTARLLSGLNKNLLVGAGENPTDRFLSPVHRTQHMLP